MNMRQVLTPSVETPDIETSSEDYARRFEGKVGVWFLRIQEEAVLRMLSQNPSSTVLDVGGGHGQLTEPLLRAGYRVTVFGSAEQCNQRIRRYMHAGQCEFQSGNILKLPFADQSFDAVISFRLVPHVRQWPRLIQELSRVARRNVIVDYPALKSINILEPLLFQLKKKMEGNTRTYTSFRENDIKKVFFESGFVTESRYAEFFFPMVLHRIMRAPGLSNVLETCCRTLKLTSLLGSPVILKMTRKSRVLG